MNLYESISKLNDSTKPKDEDQVLYKGYSIMYDAEPSRECYMIFEEGLYSSKYTSEPSLFQITDTDIYRLIKNDPYAKVVIDEVYASTGSIDSFKNIKTAKIVIDAITKSINKNNYEDYLAKIKGSKN